MKNANSGKFALPQGFNFSAATAGIKISGAPDLALAEAPEGAIAAAMFTTNRVAAAPVKVGREHIAAGKIQAVVVNSGNANCATGLRGLRDAKAVCAAVARALGAPTKNIFPSSTGVIGVPLPVEKILAATPELLKSRQASPRAVERFARAIMTTDTRPKIASARAGKASVLGVAKGAGMIHPRLATMLVYLFTDAVATPAELRREVKAAVAASFNRISIDGDTSTNDTVLLLASGASGQRITPAFGKALQIVCASLARQIVADGEGVQHVVELVIEKARHAADAERVARAIANSSLVKTAWAGADPNWGRVLAATGYSGAAMDPARVDIFFGPHQLCRRGVVARFDPREVNAYLRQPTITVRVRLNQGRATLTFWTCDLTTEYVHINADYHT